MSILINRCFILILVSLGLINIGYSQTIQKWVDKDGKVHYGKPTAFDQPAHEESVTIYNTHVSEDDLKAAGKRGREADAWYRADIRSRNAREARQRAEQTRLQDSIISGSSGSGGTRVIRSSGVGSGSTSGVSSGSALGDEIDHRVDKKLAERDVIQRQLEYIANKRARGEKILPSTVKRVGNSN